jgi:hypothetical protein
MRQKLLKFGFSLQGKNYAEFLLCFLIANRGHESDGRREEGIR